MKNTSLTVSVSLIACLAATSATASPRNADFDGDGADDLAIGTWAEDDGMTNSVGVVNILYGSGSALTDPTNRSTTIWQDLVVGSDPAEGLAEAGDEFGAALAWGDFNGDCFDDLAVGVPGENTSAGVVQLFYGSATGLSTFNDEIWDRAVSDIDDAPAAGDQFGQTLAAGDFNGDGYDDLAIGVTGDDIAVGGGGGSVHVIYGSSAGLSAVAGPGDFIFSRSTTGIADDPDGAEGFGSALAAGDFDCDGNDDLAIGDHLNNSGVGDVTIIYGDSTSGLSTTAGPSGSTQRFIQGSGNIDGLAEVDDFFGFSLAVGNFNGDTEDGLACQDLAIGAPGEWVGMLEAAGAVNVVYGSLVAGLQTTSPADDLWYQDVGSILNDSEAGDEFGHSLTVGRLDNDGFDDLAIGVPGEDSKGFVAIIRGATSTGLVDTNNQLWSQDTSNIPDSAETGDNFGTALTFGKEWNTSLDRGLAVGVSKENSDAGVVNVIYLQNTSTPTPVVLGSQLWDQGSIDTQTSDAGDLFGSVFAAPRDRPFGVCD